MPMARDMAADRRRSPGHPGDRPQDTQLRGIRCINGAVFLFVAMDAAIKAVSASLPTGEIVFFRNLFAFLPILLFMRHAGGLSLRTRDPLGHALRGLFGVAAVYCFFLSYRLLPLSQAVALGLPIPLFVTLLSVPLLGERVGPRRWAACLLGFAGVLVMTRPESAGWQIAALLPVFAALLYALP